MLAGFHGKRSREAGAWSGEAALAGARETGAGGVNGAAENATDETPFSGRYVSKRERLRVDGQKKELSTHGQPIYKFSAGSVARETACGGEALPNAPDRIRHDDIESYNAYGGGALPDAPDWIQEGAAARFVAPRRLMCRRLKIAAAPEWRAFSFSTLPHPNLPFSPSTLPAPPISPDPLVSPISPCCYFSAHSRPATCVRWSPQYGHLLTSAGMDGAVKVWIPFKESPGEWADSGKTSLCPVRVFNGHRAAVKESSWTNDAARLLTASLDATVQVADVESGATVAEVRQGGAMSVCRPGHSNPQIFATGGDYRVGSVRFWDMRMLGGASNGQSDCSKNDCKRSDSIEISNGGSMANHSSSTAAASAEPSKPVLEFPLDGGDLLDLAFDPSGSLMVTSAACTRVRGLDKGLKVWDNRSMPGVFYGMVLLASGCAVQSP
ncbi:unnamed protein product [Closterium sp. NIES-65]|nr:unnamed protein product [Closterium sp. NIES-65]